ncbi:MAG: hypothetical protein R3B99_07345 [Polyangiales bacterium]
MVELLRQFGVDAGRASPSARWQRRHEARPDAKSMDAVGARELQRDRIVRGLELRRVPSVA